MQQAMKRIDRGATPHDPRSRTQLAPQVLGYMPKGGVIAMVTSGGWQARAILSAERIAATRPRIGDMVEFRASAAPSRTIEGVIDRIAPAGSKTVEHAAFTHLGGGDIAVNPKTSTATKPYFEITVDLPAGETPELRYAITGSVRLPAEAEPVAITLTRRLTRFVNRLLQE